MKDLFKVCNSKKKLDERFQYLSTLPYLSSAKGEVNRIYNSWNGFDKDFANQFQTTNYESRLWELYTYEFLNSHDFEIEKSKSERPDFKISTSEGHVYIECVTSNSMNGGRSDLMLKSANYELEIDFISRIGSALFSKLSKKYYDLEWVKGSPLIFAIQPYHSSESLNMNVYNVVKYLYGIKIEKKLDSKGKLSYEFNKVVNQKRLENGNLIDIGSFFELPNSEFVSGVIFTNSATLGKFTRIGFQNGFDSGETEDITYFGIGYNDSSDDIKPAYFCHSVKDKPFENYNHGVTFFHNPNAKYPISDDLLFCTQCKCERHQILWRRLNFYPYNGSNARIVKTKKRASS